MASIREQKLIYHLTSLKNIGPILESGLQPRSALNGFQDIADAEILEGRAQHGLDHYVPFHWFSRNPFDGRVQKDRADEDFVLITVRRTLAEGKNWKVLPRHPLARQELRLYDYQEGLDLIDWGLMQTRDYSDAACKSVCMAECLSPVPISPSGFFMIYVPSDQVRDVVVKEVERRSLCLDVTVNRGMFC
ncbi:DUF4433 domain-containing protein [Sedimenticola hydrogenitrophicus]|uniref:DUF4433 domain-containing protein n=1 Tax=Sedimenticola hydrogenitrophicus TaxID=2967975 RepID=UPI0021A745BD|nr:DUF4433 domain-containing protein [Sedimenticola hydrogenitrophicus]